MIIFSILIMSRDCATFPRGSGSEKTAFPLPRESLLFDIFSVSPRFARKGRNDFSDYFSQKKCFDAIALDPRTINSSGYRQWV
jgi:hypothetical protein